MMGQAVELPSATMKCDTPGCGHTQAVNPREVRQYVGAACPECSAVMVTEETAASVERMLAGIDFLNGLVGPLEEKPESRAVAVSARIDTAGDLAEVIVRKNPRP